jgi:RNA polymerase sigma-70 factor (ECF subfamily)
MSRIAEGDVEALDHLYNRYYRLIYGIALRRTRDPDDAEDVVTDVMMRIYRSANTFHLGSRLSTWITKIAINASIDSVRQRVRHRSVSLEDAEDLLDKFSQTRSEIAESADCEADSLREERSSAVGDLYRHMRKSEQELLLMYYRDNLACAQIAAANQVPIGTIKSRLHRARNFLREGLESRPAYRYFSLETRIH